VVRLGVYLRTHYLELGTLRLTSSAESLRGAPPPPTAPKIKKKIKNENFTLHPNADFGVAAKFHVVELHCKRSCWQYQLAQQRIFGSGELLHQHTLYLF